MSLRQDRRAGFTLIELMVVVVIMGILALVAYPSISRNLRDGAVKKRGRTLVDLFQYLRGQAGSTGRSMFLYVKGSTNSSQLTIYAFPNTTSSCVVPTWPVANTSLIYTESIPAGAGDVKVWPEGSAFTSAGEVWLCIRPDGQLWEADECTAQGGGACGNVPISNEIKFYVDDVTKPSKSDLLVQVGLSSLPRIYQP